MCDSISIRSLVYLLSFRICVLYAKYIRDGGDGRDGTGHNRVTACVCLLLQLVVTTRGVMKAGINLDPAEEEIYKFWALQLWCPNSHLFKASDSLAIEFNS